MTEKAETDAGAPPRSSEDEHPLTLEQVAGWSGYKIDDFGGSSAGRVEGVLVDAVDGDPSWLLIRAGRLGRRTALPIDLLAGGIKRVWAPYPKQLIRSAPAVEAAAGLTLEAEEELCEHFGLPAGRGRRKRLEGRRPAATTSTPAG